jgi:hypothetical protein
MKQTATEYLFEKLWDSPKDKLTWHSILEQAKEMEKQQIKDAHSNGRSILPPNENGEQYYKETYE